LKLTRDEAKKFVEEARARADQNARERHANKKLNQHRQLVPLEEPKEEKKDD